MKYFSKLVRDTRIIILYLNYKYVLFLTFTYINKGLNNAKDFIVNCNRQILWHLLKLIDLIQDWSITWNFIIQYSKYYWYWSIKLKQHKLFICFSSFGLSCLRATNDESTTYSINVQIILCCIAYKRKRKGNINVIDTLLLICYATKLAQIICHILCITSFRMNNKKMMSLKE